MSMITHVIPDGEPLAQDMSHIVGGTDLMSCPGYHWVQHTENHPSPVSLHSGTGLSICVSVCVRMEGSGWCQTGHYPRLTGT